MSKQTEGVAVRRFASILVILAMLIQSFAVPAFAQDNDNALGEGDEVISGAAVETETSAPAEEDESLFESIVDLFKGGSSLSRDEIISQLGIAANFAVFAIDFTNDNHMEGAIAVKNLNGISSNLGNTERVYNYAPDFDVTITKTVEGAGSKQGTFKFGFFTKDGDSYTLADGIDYVYVTTDENGKGSTTVESMQFSGDKVYYVFEIDNEGNPIIEGEGTANGKSYEVSYTSNSIYDTSKVVSVGNTSYVEFLKQPGGSGTEMLQDNVYLTPELVIGETNTIDDTSIPNVYLLYGADGSEYRVKKEHSVKKVEGEFPIDFDAEFDRLANASATIADAVSNDSVKVVNIPVTESGYDEWDHSTYIRELDLSNAVCDGEVLDKNTIESSGLTTDGKLLVINVDCSNADPTDRINVPRINIDGINPSDFNKVSSDVVWNFYTTENGEYVPFAGTIWTYEIFGAILAPYAEFIGNAATNGPVMAMKARHPGGEIHHVPPAPEKGKVKKTVSVVNKSDEEDSSSETTTKEATTETTTVTTTEATTEATTEETTEETTEATTVTTTVATTEATTETTTEETTESTTAAPTTVTTTEATTEATTTPGDDSKHTTTTVATTEATTETTTVGPTTVSTTETTTETTTEATTEATTVEITTKPGGGNKPKETTTVAPTTEATTEATTLATTTEATTETTTAAPTTEATTEATTLAPTTEATTEVTTVEMTTKPDGGNKPKETTTKAPTTEAATETTTVGPTTVATTTEATTEETTKEVTTVEITTRQPSGGGPTPEPETDEVTVEETSSEATSEVSTEASSEATTASIEATTEITTAIEALSETTTSVSGTPNDNPDNPGTPGGGRGPSNPGGNTPSGDNPGSGSPSDEPGGSSGFSFDRPRSAADAPEGAATVSLRRPHSAITPAEDVPTTTVSRVIKPRAASGAALPKTGDASANGYAVMLMLLAGAAFMFTFKKNKK